MKLTKHEKKTLNELLHNVCVTRDGHKCLKCGSTQRLAASHIYPKKTYRRMEYYYENVKTLCFFCHFKFWHLNPIEADKWYEENIDKARRDRLLLMTQTIDKSPIDYKLIKIELEQKLKELNNEVKR